MIYLRRHTREISEFGGLWNSVPIYAAIFMFVMLSSIGLPGLNGFVGEFLILLGSYRAVMDRPSPSRSAASSSARSTCCGPTSA